MFFLALAEFKNALNDKRQSEKQKQLTRERLKKLVLLKAKAEKKSPLEVIREMQYSLDELKMAKKN